MEEGRKTTVQIINLSQLQKNQPLAAAQIDSWAKANNFVVVKSTLFN
jgi:hypothetical protein